MCPDIHRLRSRADRSCGFRMKVEMKERIATAMQIVGLVMFFAGFFFSGWVIAIGALVMLLGGVVYVSDKGDDG